MRKRLPGRSVLPVGNGLRFGHIAKIGGIKFVPVPKLPNAEPPFIVPVPERGPMVLPEILGQFWVTSPVLTQNDTIQKVPESYEKQDTKQQL